MFVLPLPQALHPLLESAPYTGPKGKSCLVGSLGHPARGRDIVMGHQLGTDPRPKLSWPPLLSHSPHGSVLGWGGDGDDLDKETRAQKRKTAGCLLPRVTDERDSLQKGRGHRGHSCHVPGSCPLRAKPSPRHGFSGPRNAGMRLDLGADHVPPRDAVRRKVV